MYDISETENKFLSYSYVLFILTKTNNYSMLLPLLYILYIYGLLIVNITCLIHYIHVCPVRV